MNGAAPQGGVFHRGLLSRPDCETCILRGSPVIPPEGRIGAKVAFIGEAPGREEVRLGSFFRGESGRLLDVILERAGHMCGTPIRREECWITNTLLCPVKSAVETLEDGQQRIVSSDVVIHRASVNCRNRLIGELRIVNPRVLVPLGRPALSTIRGTPTSIMKYRGGVLEIDL